MSERQIVAILFSDIVGYTAIVGENEARGVEAREKHRRLVVGPMHVVDVPL